MRSSYSLVLNLCKKKQKYNTIHRTWKLLIKVFSYILTIPSGISIQTFCNCRLTKGFKDKCTFSATANSIKQFLSFIYYLGISKHIFEQYAPINYVNQDAQNIILCSSLNAYCGMALQSCSVLNIEK